MTPNEPFAKRVLLIVATELWKMRRTTKSPGEKIVKDIKRVTRKHYSSEETISFILDGLRGEDRIAELSRGEGKSQGVYHKWSKDFMEAGKKRLAGDTAREQIKLSRVKLKINQNF